jgi:RimJ/RimL family protein N-acetyltransferase
MKLKSDVIGIHARIRTATEDDAQFILDLRLNPDLNKFLSKTDPSVEKQKEWLRAKMDQENDYHMIVEGLNGEPLAVVAIYDIDPVDKTFQWGRWIVKPGAPKYTALESALLCHEVAFHHLGLNKSIATPYWENERCVSFLRRFGSTTVREGPVGPVFEITKEDFKSIREKHRNFIRAKDEEQKEG